MSRQKVIFNTQFGTSPFFTDFHRDNENNDFQKILEEVFGKLNI